VAEANMALNVDKVPNKVEKMVIQTRQAKAPSISLPKGGGAIRGIDEKFATDPVTGTGSISIPVFTSPGRSGFGPQLSLSYDSGKGNGPFGFGWNLSIPSITRKTDKGLPKYQDNDESDVFILSGVEDLVPVLVRINGQWQHENIPSRTVDGVEYHIRRYRPRIENLFARIEYWTNVQTGESHWRSISSDNTVTIYGKTEESRIADPANPQRRIFSWLICESYDDKGNAITYEYIPEDSGEVDLSQVHEKNRTKKVRSANRYLKKIKYGNQTSRLILPDLSKMSWMFEVVFDYGEHDRDNPIPNDFSKWLCRNDPFSSYRAGFEVRTYRLCQRVLMFHHFPDEEGIGKDCLVRSTDFIYRNIRTDPEDVKKGHPIASFIASISQNGYKRVHDSGYLKKSFPPLEFEYSQATIKDEIKEMDADSLENLPLGLDGTRYMWVDLDGEGLCGIITEQGGAWFYKPNLSSLPVTGADGKLRVEAHFAPLRLEMTIPSFSDLSEGRQQLMDLNGDGNLDLVKLDSHISGYFKRSTDDSEGWKNFNSFSSLPNVSWNNPNLKFVDLTGNGYADILVITDDIAFTWYPSLAEKGFVEEGEKVYQSLDEEKGPRLVFADGIQSIYLADISGDGLADLVRIRNGEVCYWPNLGYSRFGTKVTMDNSPWFDTPDLFDQRRIRLADIDGSGTTDIIYLRHDGIRLYFNQSGNSLSDAQPLKIQFPHIDDLSSVMAVDLLGNGTSCLVWSSALPADKARSMRYIDLMGGQKPHLLTSVINNMGAETKIQYAPSTKFYLADKIAGKPWITKLPFPVHVVERVDTYDHISRNLFVTRYVYHHGYFDGIEREFRGFGLVERFDTEEFATIFATDTFPSATNVGKSSHIPPVLTKTWFHTGAYFDGSRNSRQFENEYYREPGLTDFEFKEARLLADTVLPIDLILEEEREACRALKGSLLRQEIYALDGSPKSKHPYSASERSYAIRRLQPQGDNCHAVFFVHSRETIDYHYERNPIDARISHVLTLEVDDFGNVVRSSTIGYGRRQQDTHISIDHQQKQNQVLVTYLENSFTNHINLDDVYRSPLHCESRIYELTGLALGPNQRFDFNSIDHSVNNSSHIAFEDVPLSRNLQKRLIKHECTLYRKDDLSGALPFGQIESLALPFEHYILACTSGLVKQVFGNYVTDTMLSSEGKFAHFAGDSNWWIPSGLVFYSPRADDTSSQELSFARQHFFLAHRFQDAFGNCNIVYYDKYALLLLQTRDPIGNIVTATTKDDLDKDLVTLNYRVLQPWQVTDPNGNRSAVSFDALGVVVATAVMGKIQEPDGRPKGDLLTDDFNPDITDADLATFFADPHGTANRLLKSATTRTVYNVNRFYTTQNSSNAVYTATLGREKHLSDLNGDQSNIQVTFTYFDGYGQEIQRKVQAESGKVAGVVASRRWICSGWTIFNNKGKPVKKYEPFFSTTHDFEFAKTVGISSTMFYDSLERLVGILNPDHTYEKVVFDNWRQEIWDVNDTVLQDDPKHDPHLGDFFSRLLDIDYLPTWHDIRKNGHKGSAEEAAALKAIAHANTPTVIYFDPLGRAFLTISNNGTRGNYQRCIELDIEDNERTAVDALDRKVMNYDYDMLGNRIKQKGMDIGERWTLNDVSGKVIYLWDSRSYRIRITYDSLRRPHEIFLREGVESEQLVERTVYGETQGNTSNHRGRVYQHFDSSGVLTNEEYDFKGNLLRSRHQLASNYKNKLDWSTAIILEDEIFKISTAYDALNRPLTLMTPDKSVIQSVYNEANLLERVHINIHGAETITTLISNIDYDPKGQPELIEYGNGIITKYQYDENITSRLIHLQTVRGSEKLQDLFYSYDPIGNITHIQDDADIHNVVFFHNKRVEPSADYTYDAIYRLIEATGREHLGQTPTGALLPPTPTNPIDEPRVNLPHPGDGNAMGNYTEDYTYDSVGNILEIIHHGIVNSNPGWRRIFQYNKSSLIQSNTNNNCLSSTNVGSVTEDYDYDSNGNIISMAHLPIMKWDHHNQLKATSRQKVNQGATPEITYYVYDSSGRRVRKVTERQASAGQIPRRKDERIYLANFEIYRQYNGSGSTVKLQRETIHVINESRRIALIDTRTKGNDGSQEQVIRYQFSNHLGSASLELDAEGNVISYEEYYPFGSTSYHAVRADTDVPLKRYRYIGKERDNENGFYYNGARYYAPWIGRWINCDPEGIEDGLNLFEYVGDNPISFIDTSGKQRKGWSNQKFLRYVANLSAEKAQELGIPSNIYGWLRNEVRRTKNFNKLVSQKGLKYVREVMKAEASGKLRVPFDKQYHIGHKTAHVLGGSNDFNNLRFEIAHDNVSRGPREGAIAHRRDLEHIQTNSVSGHAESSVEKTATNLQTAETAVKDVEKDVGKEVEKVVEKDVGKEAASLVEKDAAKAVEKVVEKDAAKTVEKVVEKDAAKTVEKVVEKDAAKAIGKVVAKTSLKTLGTKALKIIPIIGIIPGLYSLQDNLREGNNVSAGLDAIGFVPVVGDFVDFVRLTAELVPLNAEAIQNIKDKERESGLPEKFINDPMRWKPMP
jgi:RHS repeat-associated protein